MYNLAYIIDLLVQLGKYIPKLDCQKWDQTVNKWFFEIQIRESVTNSPPQDPPDHIACPGIGGKLSITNGKGHGTDVICNNTYSDVRFVVVAILNIRVKRDKIHQRPENIRIVIRSLSLNSHAKPLEAHSSVHMLVGQGLQDTRR